VLGSVTAQSDELRMLQFGFWEVYSIYSVYIVYNTMFDVYWAGKWFYIPDRSRISLFATPLSTPVLKLAELLF
jgi:hypothetical protein